MMNISGIANQLLSLAALQTNQTTQANQISSIGSSSAVQKAFAKAAARLAQERETTTAQISTYGQVKSGFARVQDSSKALATTQATTSTEDLKKNLQAFVSAYNDTRSAAAQTTTGSAQTASRELQRTVGNSDLKSLGITQNANGTLTLGTKALDMSLQSNADAVRSAASRIGSATQQIATRALAGNGSINTSLNTLNTREQNIEARQVAQQQLMTQSQQQVEQTSTRLNGVLSSISTYNRIFSL